MNKKFVIKGKVKSKSKTDRSMLVTLNGYINCQDVEKLTYVILTKLAKNEKTKLAVISAVYDFINDQDEAH